MSSDLRRDTIRQSDSPVSGGRLEDIFERCGVFGCHAEECRDLSDDPRGRRARPARPEELLADRADGATSPKLDSPESCSHLPVKTRF